MIDNLFAFLHATKHDWSRWHPHNENANVCMRHDFWSKINTETDAHPNYHQQQLKICYNIAQYECTPLRAQSEYQVSHVGSGLRSGATKPVRGGRCLHNQGFTSQPQLALSGPADGVRTRFGCKANATLRERRTKPAGERSATTNGLK